MSNLDALEGRLSGDCFGGGASARGRTPRGFSGRSGQLAGGVQNGGDVVRVHVVESEGKDAVVLFCRFAA